MNISEHIKDPHVIAAFNDRRCGEAPLLGAFENLSGTRGVAVADLITQSAKGKKAATTSSAAGSMNTFSTRWASDRGPAPYGHSLVTDP